MQPEPEKMDKHTRYNRSEKGRARYLAYYHRRTSDPTPIGTVTDWQGRPAITKGGLFRLRTNMQREARRRQLAIERGEAQLAELRRAFADADGECRVSASGLFFYKVLTP